MTTDDPTIDPELRRRDTRHRTFLLWVAGWGGLLSLAALVLAGARAALSTSAGALLALLNLALVIRIVKRGAGSAKTPPGGASLLASVKTLALFGVVAWLLTSHLVGPLFLVLGYTALPIGIAFGALLSDKARD
jgi:hypothetical protein